MSYQTVYTKVYLDQAGKVIPKPTNKKVPYVIYFVPIVVKKQFNKKRECDRYNRQWKARVKKALCDEFDDASYEHLKGAVRNQASAYPLHHSHHSGRI